MAYQDHQVQWEEGDQEDPKDNVGDVVSLELQVKMVQQVPQGPKENRAEQVQWVLLADQEMLEQMDAPVFLVILEDAVNRELQENLEDEVLKVPKDQGVHGDPPEDLASPVKQENEDNPEGGGLQANLVHQVQRDLLEPVDTQERKGGQDSRAIVGKMDNLDKTD